MRRLIQCLTPRRLARVTAATFAQLTMLLDSSPSTLGEELGDYAASASSP